MLILAALLDGKQNTAQKMCKNCLKTSQAKLKPKHLVSNNPLSIFSFSLYVTPHARSGMLTCGVRARDQNLVS